MKRLLANAHQRSLIIKLARLTHYKEVVKRIFAIIEQPILHVH